MKKMATVELVAWLVGMAKPVKLSKTGRAVVASEREYRNKRG